MMIDNRTYLLTILLALIISNIFSICIAQPSNKKINIDICNSPKIEWIKEISSESINSSSGGFFDSLVDLILGKDNLVF